jgi:hypothetical protein
LYHKPEIIMKRNTLLLLLIFVLLVIAAFLFVDFRVSQQTMTVNSTAGRYTIGNDSGDAIPAGRPLDLYVIAPRWLAPKLEAALADALDNNPYVGQLTVQQEPLQAASDSVLVVRVDEPAAALWTPLYTRTEAQAKMAYALNGEVDWIGVTPVVMESGDPPRPDVRVDATLDLAGSGYGLISRPGYFSYLAAEIAAQINTLLEQQVSGAGL